MKNWNVQWSEHNSQRRYPLADDSTGQDVSGGFEIPNDFLIGCDIPVHAGMGVDPARFFVYTISAYSTGYAVVIGYQPADGDPVPVASAMVPSVSHTTNTSYALGGIGDFDDTVGKVVIGRLDNIDNQPPGVWTFSEQPSRSTLLASLKSRCSLP